MHSISGQLRNNQLIMGFINRKKGVLNPDDASKCIFPNHIIYKRIDSGLCLKKLFILR